MHISTSLRHLMLTGSTIAAMSLGWSGAAMAQVVDPNAPLGGLADDANANGENRDILVTGSRIRQDPNSSPLPLQILSAEELAREGISSPE